MSSYAPEFMPSEIATLQGFISDAKNALQKAYDATVSFNPALAATYNQAAVDAVKQYYSAQTSVRGYANDALSVINNQSLFGVTANQDVLNAVGQSAFDTIKFQLMVNLASADLKTINDNNGVVPTENQITNYHYRTYLEMNIPLTAFGGGANASLGLDWGGKTLYYYEIDNNLSNNLFSQNFSCAQTQQAMQNVASAGFKAFLITGDVIDFISNSNQFEFTTALAYSNKCIYNNTPIQQILVAPASGQDSFGDSVQMYNYANGINTIVTTNSNSSGSAVSYIGSGFSNAASNETINIIGASSISITGSNNTLNMDDNSNAKIIGDKNTINASTNDTINSIGSATTVNVTGLGDTITIGGNSQNATDANLDQVNFSAGITGTVNETAGSRVNISGNGINVNLAGWSSLGLVGSSDTVTSTQGGDSIWIGGNGATSPNIDTVNASQPANVYELDNSRIAINGNAITTNIGTNDHLVVTGSADTVNVSGTGDYVNIGGNGETATNANLDTVNASQPTNVYEMDNSRIAVNGNGVTTNLGNNDHVIVTGSADTVNDSSLGGNSINIGGNGKNASDTNDDFVNVTASDNIYEMNNSRVDVNASSSQINAGTSDTLGVNGTANNVYATTNGAGDSIWITQGYNSINMGTGNTAYLNGDFNSVTGSYDTISILGATYGGDTVNQDTSFAQNGSHNTITVNQGSKAFIYDNLDTITATGSPDVFISGNNNVITATNSYIDHANGATGNIKNGVAFGFAGDASVVTATLNGTGESMSTLAQDFGDTSASASLMAALQSVQQTIDVNDTAPISEGSTWTKPTVTWAITDPYADTFTESVYKTDAKAAFAAWAANTGVDFVETNDPQAADIQIQWANLDTAQSGVVGLTQYTSSGGAMSGVLISVENPIQDALQINDNGDVLYAGTQATLSQVLLHEIGHAIGLGDTADLTSVMSYYLTGSNQDLSTNDVTEAKKLYLPSTASATSNLTTSSLASTEISDLGNYLSTTGIVSQLAGNDLQIAPPPSPPQQVAVSTHA